MRVGLVIGAAQVGGAERQVQQLSHALRQLGVESLVLVMERPRRRGAQSALPLTDLPHEFLWRSRWLPGIAGWRIRRAVRVHRLDLLHFYHVDAIRLALLFGRSPRPRLVGSLRGLQFANDPTSRSALRKALPALSAMTTNCKAIESAFRDSFPEFERSMAVLPNLIAPRPKKSDYATQGAFRVLFVGSLKPVKNPLLLLDAVERAAATGLDLAIDYVGHGPLESALRERTVGLPGNVSVRLLGALDAAQIPYADCDVLVSTSEREGASNSLLEALASGTPVIASAVGGSVEIVEESQAGRLFPSCDAAALAASLLELAQDAALRERLGRAGVRHIVTRHDPAAVARQHVEFYRAQLAETEAPS